jgi:hypothetical protein
MISKELEEYCKEKENQLSVVKDLRVDPKYAGSTDYFRNNAQINWLDIYSRNQSSPDGESEVACEADIKSFEPSNTKAPPVEPV